VPLVASSFGNEIGLFKKTRNETRLEKEEEKTKRVKTLEKQQKCPKILPSFLRVPFFLLVIRYRVVVAYSYKKAATRAPKPRTPAEAKVTRPAEESAVPVDSAAPLLLAPEEEEPRVELEPELDSESSDEEPVAEETAAVPVSVPVPVTMVALSGASTTTVVELPTDTSKEVSVREMLIKR
jgi:cytoskeletal protein RodZ